MFSLNVLIALVLLYLQLSGCKSDSAAHKKPITRPLVASEIYTHHEYVDDDDKDQYHIFWKVLSNREIQFELHVRTTGWLGLGISLSGGMKGADILIGWHDSHGAHIQDCHAKDFSTPVVDHVQNWNLIDGAEVDGYTILKVKRSLYTCDTEDDKEIKSGINYLIFAWSDHDPHCTDWKYHGVNRHTKSMNLLSYKNENLTEQEALPNNTLTYDLTVKDIVIPVKNSYYYCKLFELPKFKNDLHVIQYEALVSKDNDKLVHYILGFLCDSGFVPSKVRGGECNTMPVDAKRRCKSKVFHAWSHGNKYNYTLSNEAGFMLFNKNETKYIMLEIFYTNPYSFKEKIDNSGIRLYMTSTLRQNDIGVLAVTSDSSPLSIQIPGNSKHFHYTVICYPQCTERFFPSTGVQLFSGLLYTHSAGVSAKLSLIRDSKLIARLFENENFDPNHITNHDIEPFQLLKGDSLILECEYNTMDRSNFTLNGFSRSAEESCSAFLYYYPRLPAFDFCESTFATENLFEFYTELISESLMPDIELNEEPETFNAIETLIRYQMPSSSRITHEFEAFFKSHYSKMAECGTLSLPNQTLVREFPHYTEVENVIEDVICDYKAYPPAICNANELNFTYYTLLTLSVFTLFFTK